MREILFRGKRLDGVWMEGYYKIHGLHLGTIEEEIYQTISEFGNTPLSYEVDPATVGQYTGLTDKNGKRIFEGDIVEGCDFDEEDGYGVVEWHDGAFEINNQYTTGTFHENYWGRELEVIGNIHDNQALLEGGEG